MVVRTRNRPALLRDAIESLARQTARPSLVVVVNDGGAAVGSVLDSASGRLPDPARKSCPSAWGARPQPIGALRGRRTRSSGFSTTTTSATPITWSASCGRTGRVPRRSSIPTRPRCATAGTAKAWRESERTLQYSLDFDPDYLLLANYIPIHTLLAPAPLLRRAGGFDETLEYSEDWDLLIRLSAETSFRHVRAVTCEYRVFDGPEGDPAHVLRRGGGVPEGPPTDLRTLPERGARRRAWRA